MSGENIIFIKEKNVDLGKLHPIKDCQIGHVYEDHGCCSCCGEGVPIGADFCANCGAEFGRAFDLSGIL